MASMTKRVRLLEEDFEGTETKLQNTSAKLDEATKAADESERYYQLNHYSIYSVTARGRGYAYAITEYISVRTYLSKNRIRVYVSCTLTWGEFKMKVELFS